MFGSDFAGYRKIFYLHENGFWAVSNSLFRLVEHLRRHGRPIVPNYAQLGAVGGRGTALGQLTSFATPVQNIALLPVGTTLRIGPTGVSVEPVTSRREPSSYEDALERFVGLWVSRFMTLISHPRTVVVSDLTGGIDSRTVFGLLHRTVELLGPSAEGRLRYRCGSVKGDQTDLRVARSLEDRFAISLNEEAPKRDHARADPFELWRDLCLGIYHPVYFPGRRTHPFDIEVGGGGGENHRPFYAKQADRGTFEKFVAASAERIQPAFLAHQFERELRDAMREIEGRSPDEDDRLILHYRHFRNRLHAGRAPQCRTVLAPLGSRLLEDCAALAGRSRMQRGQILYDLMASTVPDLLDIPFDAEAKAPGAEVRAALTRAPVRDRPAPGAIFAQEPAFADEPAGSRAKALKRMRRELDAARKLPFVRAFLGRERLAEADAALQAAEKVGRFGHATDALPIAAVLTSAMVDP